MGITLAGSNGADICFANFGAAYAGNVIYGWDRTDRKDISYSAYLKGYSLSFMRWLWADFKGFGLYHIKFKKKPR
jgi:hypothetical protein